MQRTPRPGGPGDADDPGPERGALVKVAPSASQNGLVAIMALAIVALLVLATWRPGLVGPDATPGPTGDVAIAASSTPTETASPSPTRSPAVRPTVKPDACVLPARLPVPEPPVATPRIEPSSVATLFTSPLYARTIGAGYVARDDPDNDWAMGLWFTAAGSAAPQLLVTPENGMVIPLALASAGDAAAVWWLPERRSFALAACRGGIYVVATDGSSSRLVATGDWSLPFATDGSPESSWRDPRTGPTAPREYLLPSAAFSSDGRALAVIDGREITLYGPEPDWAVGRSHTGACPSWAWSPVGATFVAGCEHMTTAWLVDAAEGFVETNVALPAPSVGDLRPAWESGERAIGITRDGGIRVVRFYGIATGCEGPDPCSIPDPGYAASTIDPSSRELVLRSGQLDFLAESATTHLSADASWLFTHGWDETGWAIRIGSGAVSSATRLESYVGAALDGSVIYGSRFDEASGSVILESVDRDGRSVDLASIGHPQGTAAAQLFLALVGLRVVAGT